VTFFIGEKSFVLLLDGKWQRIGDTDYCVRCTKLCRSSPIVFAKKLKRSVTTSEEKEVSKNEKLKKENKMSLSLGTWIMIVILTIFIAKIANKISLKTIFKPTKKISRQVKKDWDES
jgi:anaerobic C4-dicarboxylate transporter